MAALASSATTPVALESKQHMLAPFCGWCYATQVVGEAKMLRCSKCRKRVYCSKACQLNDWKVGAHKHWCGASGEIGIDIAVRPAAPGKGNGMFAMRRFERGEKIMVERAAAVQLVGGKPSADSLERMPQGMKRAAACLMPHDYSDISSKFAPNAFDTEDGSEGLFLHMACSPPKGSNLSFSSPPIFPSPPSLVPRIPCCSSLV